MIKFALNNMEQEFELNLMSRSTQKEYKGDCFVDGLLS